MSNYHSFGDLKFIPDLSRDSFKKILLANPLYTDKDEKLYKQVYE
jgi:hypothetical protein